MEQLFKSAQNNDINYLQENLNNLYAKDEQGRTLLHYAVVGSSYDVVDFLLLQDFDVNIADRNGETPLFDAVRRGNLKISKKLILKYAKVNLHNFYKKETPLHLAAHSGNIDLVTLLVESGASPQAFNQDDLLPIHYAVLAGNIHLIDYLLQAGNHSWFILDKSQNTLLHFACRTTNIGLIEMLIEHQLDVNALNDQFETPLMIAARFSTQRIVRLLLNHGAIIEIINRRYEDAIKMSKIYEQHDIHEYLLFYQMLPKYQFYYSEQIVTVAVLNRDHNLVRTLIEQGAKLVPNGLGLTALDYAKKYKFNVIVNILNRL